MSELELLGLESSEGGTVTVSPGDFFFFFFLRMRWLSQFPVLGLIQEKGMRRASQEFFSLGFITPWSFCSTSVMQHFAGGILGESPLSFA